MLEKIKKLIDSPATWIRLFSTIAMINLIFEWNLHKGELSYYAAGIEFSIWLAAELLIEKKEK